MKKQVLLSFLALLPIMANAYDALTDGETFTATTEQGVELTFKVLSAAAKTCQVGDGNLGDNGHNIISPNYQTLTTLTIPAKVNDLSVVSVGQYAFYNCRSLELVKISEGVRMVDAKAFGLCKKLVTVELPTTLVSVGDQAFYECPLSNMTTISLPEGLTTIGEDAFSDFSEDKPLVATKRSVSITLPSTLESIGHRAFMTEGTITEVNANMAVPMEIPDRVFGYIRYTDREYNDEVFYDKANLYVPTDTKELYANTAGWSRFVNILVKGEQICATPVINYKQGMLQFECATEAVTYHYEFTAPDNGSYTGNNIILPTVYTVKVYACKEGYTDSKVATKDIDVRGLKGDVNGDGSVSITDAVSVVNIILNNGEEHSTP